MYQLISAVLRHPYQTSKGPLAHPTYSATGYTIDPGAGYSNWCQVWDDTIRLLQGASGSRCTSTTRSIRKQVYVYYKEHQEAGVRLLQGASGSRCTSTTRSIRNQVYVYYKEHQEAEVQDRPIATTNRR
jgi:hypothetical protein